MTNKSESVEFITQRIRCPYCKNTNTYQISIKKQLFLPYSIFDNCLVATLFGLAPLVVLLLVSGWQVLALALIGASLITLADRLLTTSVWRLAQIIIWQIKKIPWFSRQRGEVFVRSFTVVLTCKNPKCPSPAKQFQAQLSLPIERGEYNTYSISVET